MHLAHTGLNGDATDGRLGELVQATISIVSDAACAVLGGLRKCGLSAEDGGRVGFNQCESAGDKLAEFSGSVASIPKSMRFTLPQRSDGRSLVEFAKEQPSPVKRKLSAAIATDVETERKLEPAPTTVKRAYHRKRKRASSKEKQAPMKRLNASRMPNKRLRTSKESLSNKVHSVLVPTIP